MKTADEKGMEQQAQSQEDKHALETEVRQTHLTAPASFRNPVEYNAEYILLPAGTIAYSATGKVEQVPDIYFARYPVTNKQYRRFIRYVWGAELVPAARVPLERFREAFSGLAATIDGFGDYLGADSSAWHEKLKSKYDENRKFNADDQPVVGVSWYAARTYCLWLSLFEQNTVYRLPREIEWERAVAGRREDGPSRKYPWPADKGEPSANLANFGFKKNKTTPVGRYPEGATPEGLMDMAGNVWEWQENWEDEKEKKYRALRGGSWDFNTHYLQCRNRLWSQPLDRFNFIGFRVVRAQS